MPDWVLTIAYWMHMAANVLWIGGLFYYAVILVPALGSTEVLSKEPALLEVLRKRFNPLAWLSLATLILTGLMQMTASSQYQGLLSLGNTWSLVIFIKHTAIILMVIFAGYQTWILQPKLSRYALELALRKDETGSQNQSLLSRSLQLSQLNLILGFLVLGLTAIARTA